MCLAQQHSDAGEAQNCNPLVSSQALYHCAPHGSQGQRHNALHVILFLRCMEYPADTDETVPVTAVLAVLTNPEAVTAMKPSTWLPPNCIREGSSLEFRWNLSMYCVLSLLSGSNNT